MNSKDPLRDEASAAPGALELFHNLSRVSAGFGGEDVVTAAANLLVNAIRQQKATRREAMAAFDEVCVKAKYVLLDQHYDMTGRRRNIFPYNQNINVELVGNKTKIHGI